MAVMYPEEPHPGTKSRAELDLFASLHHQLSDDFTVFHGVAWQIRDTRTGIQDGETDFIVVNSSLDILIIEVKGGAISYDGEKAQWFSNANPIKDPFKQGRRAKYSLLKKLKEKNTWAKRWINIGYAVAFPDVSIKSDLRLDAPRELILDSSEMGDLSLWVDQAFRYLRWSGEYRTVKNSKEDKHELVALLAPTWAFDNDLARRVELERDIIARLTHDQFMALDFLERYRRVAISGCAGSGKTMVAIEKASRLAKGGFRTLFLCHNPNLAAFLSSLIENNYIEVFDFITWIYKIIGDDSITSPSEWSQYAEPTYEQLETAFTKIIQAGEKYDAIIVDEGQDFRDNWWIVVEAAMKDAEQGILYIFHDDNQALYLFGSQLRYPIEAAPFILSKNCRNTGKIFTLLQDLHPQAPEPSTELAQRGVFREFICSKYEIIETFRKAFRLARDLYDYDELIILTAEIGPARTSKLNGLKIRLLDRAPQWQEEVNRYLPFVQLSGKSYPSMQDIGTVALEAQKELHRLLSENYQLKQNFDHRRRFTNVRWYVDPRDGIKILMTSRRTAYHKALIYDFLAGTNWPDGIPKSEARITAVEDASAEVHQDVIPLYSVASYKGLESDGVIFFYWGHYPTGDKNLALNSLYVGISRAKHLLYFISPLSMASIVERAKQGLYDADPDLFRL